MKTLLKYIAIIVIMPKFMCYSQEDIREKLKIMPALSESNIRKSIPSNFATSGGPVFRLSDGSVITTGHLRKALESYIELNRSDYNELYLGLSDQRDYVRQACNISLQEFTGKKTKFNCYAKPNSSEHIEMVNEWKKILTELSRI